MSFQNKKKEGILRRVVSLGVFPHQWAFTLLCPLRNIFFSPSQLIKNICLRNDYCVLEVGCGPGYFSGYVAKELNNGKLFLADIQQEMLNYARRRLEKKGLSNVEYYLCNGETFDFNDSYFDVIYMVAVIGEVENKIKYIKEFYRILKPGGILSITEIIGDPDKMAIDDLKFLIECCGFSICCKVQNRRNFTITFVK